MKGALEGGVGDAFARGDEARAELNAARAHFEEGGDRGAAPDTARDEDGHVLDRGEDFLRENAGGDGADMTAGFGAFDDEAVHPRTHQLAGERGGGREGEQLDVRRLDRGERGAGGQAAREHDVGDAQFGAGGDQIEQQRVECDQVDAEGAGW